MPSPAAAGWNTQPEVVRPVAVEVQLRVQAEQGAMASSAVELAPAVLRAISDTLNIPLSQLSASAMASDSSALLVQLPSPAAAHALLVNANNQTSPLVAAIRAETHSDATISATLQPSSGGVAAADGISDSDGSGAPALNASSAGWLLVGIYVAIGVACALLFAAVCLCAIRYSHRAAHRRLVLESVYAATRPSLTQTDLSGATAMRKSARVAVIRA
jgi:hypothetical protein